LIEEPKLVAAQDILRVKDRHVVRLTYIGAIEGTPVLDEDHDEYRWWTLEEIKKMSKENFDSFFKELLDKDVIF